jgi:hypothetical protein
MVQARILAWPRDYRCPFLLRDDDICFFTKTNMLQNLWDHAWRKGYVVSFSVLPKIACDIESGRHIARLSKKTLMVPPEVRGKNQKADIRENPRLSRYLRDSIEEGKTNLILHGYTHEKIKEKPEFAITDRSEIEHRLGQGQKIFKDAFGRKAKVFVPPWDKISREAWEVLSRKSMGICRRFPQFWDEYLQAFSKGYAPIPYRTYFSTIFPWYGKNYVSFYNDSYDFRHNGYFTSFLLDPYEYLEKAKRVFLRQYKARNVSFWGNHYWEFFFDWEEKITYRDQKKCLDSFLDFVDEYNIWKCGIEDLLIWLQKIGQLKVKKTGETLTIRSEIPIENLTVQSRSRCTIIGADEYIETREGTYVLDVEPNRNILIR